VTFDRKFIALLRCTGLVVLMSAAQLTTIAQAERIKDLASVAGVRSNPLVGYGLVIGLNGTGDQNTSYTSQSLKSMLKRFGVVLPAGTTPKPKNIAAIMVSASLPPFAKPGQRIDITVSSVANAKSLRGGTLLMTPLRGVDGRVYAVAQGNLVVGGFGIDAKDGSSITVNVPSVGRIPGGASVEVAAPTPFAGKPYLVLNLHRADFTTAERLSETINAFIGKGSAVPIDASSIRVQAPQSSGPKVAFISTLENLTLEPGEAPARVIINSRTGTVVISQHVRVMPAAVSHGSLTVTIQSQDQVSQPNPLSNGQTVVVPKTNIKVEQPSSRMFLFQPGVLLDEIVRAVNQVGAAPGDLVAILEALKEAGALRAELVVI